MFVFNCRRAQSKYIQHLNSFDIIENSNRDGSDSRQEQTYLYLFLFLQQSGLGIIYDSVGHGSLLCQPLLLNISRVA